MDGSFSIWRINYKDENMKNEDFYKLYDAKDYSELNSTFGSRDMGKGLTMQTKAVISNITIYEVKGDTETCEGRGPKYIVGYFSSQTLAEQAAVGKGIMGCRGYVTPINALKLDFEDGSTKFLLDQPIQVMVMTKEQLRSQAVSKLKASLTEEEIVALNIKV